MLSRQVLLMDPLPSINKVYSLVIQEESNNCSVSIPPSREDSSILVNASDARKHFGCGKGNAGTKNKSRFCTFCNRTNHTVEFCYQKHGYPKSFALQSIAPIPSHCNIKQNKFFQSVINSSVSNILVSALWHFRLRYLSNQRSSNMHSLYPNSIVISNYAY